MGTTTKIQSIAIADALFTKGQQRILAVLFGNPDRSFYANEIIKLADSGTGAVQRELARLHGAALVTVEQVGRQKHYQANPASPVFEELRGIVLKTSGLADVLRNALRPFDERIDAAFIFGSVAKRQDSADSDVDLMVIGAAIGYADLFSALEPAGVKLGRSINPTIYTCEEWRLRLSEGSAFANRVSEQAKIWIIGDDSVLEVG